MSSSGGYTKNGNHPGVRLAVRARQRPSKQRRVVKTRACAGTRSDNADDSNGG